MTARKGDLIAPPPIGLGAAAIDLLRQVGRSIQALHFFGSAGIAVFGWAICELLNWSGEPYLLHWFCAALVIYNADRLRPDPADERNIPQRTRQSMRIRRISVVVLSLAASVLVGVPIASHDWVTLGLVVGGAVVCLNYSFPLFGFRFKDVPLLKTFFAPTIVTAAVIGLPWIHQGTAVVGLGILAMTLFRVWTFLFFNMVICDLRDVEGDRETGIVSVPVALGRMRTMTLLIGLLVVIEGLAIAAASVSSLHHAETWAFLAVVAPMYLGWLLIALRRARSESFYEWFVEGMLFLPAIAVVATQR